ncbi:MAG: magnesium-translocating P-type ATPase [Dehalobacter sp.]|nr:magnesium-translocating P-type ATPase [Dehalobacter sp.]
MSDFPYWALSIETVLERLQSSPNGLSTTAAEKLIKKYGLNQIQSHERVTTFKLFLSQFRSPIMLILLVAVVISAFLKDWTDAGIIILIVLGSALLSFFQEYNASNAAAKLKEQLSFNSKVMRDGQVVTLPSENIVPGDIVMLSAGSLIPADGLILSVNDFFVNQALLTGETLPVEKRPGQCMEDTNLQNRSNVVFMGTSVRSGSANVVITGTGRATEFGQIADRLNLRPPETEFETGIKHFGFLLTEVMLILVIGIFFFNVLLNKPVFNSLLFSIALAVGLTPQLLPAIINMNLSKGSQQMGKSGVIVRRLEAIENFGSMDILCTDKTGTLTEGVVQLNGVVDVQGLPSEKLRLLARLNASLQTGIANPLDDAIIAQEDPGAEQYDKVDEIPYDFIRKRLSIVVRDNTNLRTMITKGALLNVLEICSQVEVQGKPIPLESDNLADINQRFENWSEQGYRVLGIATRNMGTERLDFRTEDEQDMCFMGFLLFLDPPKKGIKETLEGLEKMGVNLKIITGDNKLVSRHISQAIGLTDEKLITGDELHHTSDEALMHVVENYTIFAEVDPNQKERIILALKKRGHVVGYMGDGINDAPSLHSADVGISVANAVDVAKEAADFVLLKQDLNVLKEGILQGRKTFANTLKYIFMATSANFGNMFSMAGASLILPFLPMLPKQVLMINFLTDLPEMTIASDNVDGEVIKGPRRMDIKFIRRFMFTFGLLSSIFDYATFFVLMYVMKANQQVFQTGWFIESILSASFIVFAVRTRLPIFRSKPSSAMVMMTVLVAGITVALPYSKVGPLLGFVPLPFHYIALIAGIVLLYMLAAELVKKWFYHNIKNA